MNQIHILNYNINNEMMIIKEVSNILTPYSRYVITRGSNMMAHLEVTLETNLSFTTLLNTKNSIERHLEVLQENGGLYQGKVQLMKEHLSFQNQLILKCTYNVKCSLQDFLTDTYYFLQIIHLKPNKIYPIMIYHMAKVFNQCNLLRKDQFYELLLNKQENEHAFCQQIEKETLEVLEALELEHAKFIGLLDREWYRLCVNINKQAESYMKELSSLSINKEYRSNVIVRNEVVKQLIENIYNHIFSFLNSGQIDNDEYIQQAYCFALQNKSLKLNHFIKRRK